jgi:hypothetical protein
VTTNVGNYREFTDSYVVNWEDRANYGRIYRAIRAALEKGRRQETFYSNFSFEKWANTWKETTGCE